MEEMIECRNAYEKMMGIYEDKYGKEVWKDRRYFYSSLRSIVLWALNVKEEFGVGILTKVISKDRSYIYVAVKRVNNYLDRRDQYPDELEALDYLFKQYYD